MGRVTAGITPEQRSALQWLASFTDPSTYLAGGVAVAIRLGHRLSRDLDLFTPSGDPATLADSIVQSGAPAQIISRGPGTLHLEVEGIPASILRYAYPLLSEPEQVADLPVPVASIDDLICMKLSAIGGRGARKDFWDLHALVSATGRGLGPALAAFQRKYASEDVGHVVRSLVYFADAEAEPMTAGLTELHWSRIRSDLEAWVRDL
ncbi:MAG: nucleotidyl transferase AbiEii/AbiGii toxin family protein [Deltaproteobacteria bacterium]|nr:nucleotidyl transferase AbiEii/AbiGii toxin family protein [Deltaproteobacteria bacterium]